mgnify:CR=1 FL=1
MNTQHHWQEIIEGGSTIIKGFYDKPMMDKLKARSKETISGLSVVHRERFKSNGTLCNFADHPQFADLISQPRVVELLKAFGGTDPRWLSGYLISKPSGGPPLFWHQDWWGWDHDISYKPEPISLFFMVYLTDTTPENGCLRAIPGSHTKAHPLHRLDDGHGEDLARYENPDDPAYASHGDEVAVEITSGDLLIGDSRLLHGAYANTVKAERPLLISWYIPSFDTLPESIQARFQSIYLRQDLDVDAGERAPITTEDWSEQDYRHVKGMAPLYQGNAMPTSWCRRPDLNKMQPWPGSHDF